MIKKNLWIVVSAFVLVLVIYLLGPKPPKVTFDTRLPDIPSQSLALETYVQAKELKHRLKPDNNAEIIWYNGATKAKTPVSILYLHGFSASRREGFPTHVKFAEKFACNLFLTRLAEHGIDTTDAMVHLTAQKLWNSAVEALAIAKKLGNEVVIMSTSTGGTLALKLAASFPEIKGLINFSPNLEINDPAAFLLNDPWGLQLARYVFNGKNRTVPSNEIYRRYWYDTYRLEALVALEDLVENVNKRAIFEQVSCPVFSGVYFKDESLQDPVIRVAAVKKMHKLLATPAVRKIYMEFPSAKTHVMACDLYSDAIDEVFEAISNFAEIQLRMRPVHQ